LNRKPGGGAVTGITTPPPSVIPNSSRIDRGVIDRFVATDGAADSENDREKIAIDVKANRVLYLELSENENNSGFNIAQ